MMAKRDIAEDEKVKADHARKEAEKERVKRNFGKTQIIGKSGKSNINPDAGRCRFHRIVRIPYYSSPPKGFSYLQGVFYTRNRL